MSEKRKYPKSFYDDGLGDILEWIDDEVLAPSLAKSDKESSKRSKKERKKVKLYGDNEISVKADNNKKPKQVSFELMQEDESVKVDKKLEDRSRGLINRLAAQTMPFVTSEFEKLYSTNSRASVNATIFNHIEASIIQEHAIAKRKLVAELMLLVAYLDSKVSHGIGASLVHWLVAKFENLYVNNKIEEDKRLDNILYCIVNLYIIGLISANVIFEITKRMCSKDFKPKSVELLLLVFKSIGFQLRKDNSGLMRQLILMAQENCKKLKSNSSVNQRVEFMMEAVGAIKNNNMSKLGNYGCDIDKDTIESTLKGLVKRTKLADHLSDASYDEILSSANWYLLETRLDENEATASEKEVKKVEVTTSSKTEKKVCKALGLNKPAEQTIFGALLKVSDYVEASNVIIGFGLNYCSDAMLVCVHVAIHEKKYNPFYYNLINNLCKFNRKYKMATKFTIQDKIRVLSRMTGQKVTIFKQLCFELIKSDAMPITILKAIEWADLSESTKEFLTHLLEGVSELPDEQRRHIMAKVDKKSSFAGAMRTFTKCFLKCCNLFH